MTLEQSSANDERSIDLDVNPDHAPPSDPWSVDEVLTVILLVAATLRIVASVVAQFPFYSLISDESTTRRIGYVLTGADFADGQGVLLLLFILGLVWWGLTRRFESSTLDLEETTQSRRRAHRALTWLWALFGVTAIGAMSEIAGLYLYYSSSNPTDVGVTNGSSESVVTAAHLIGSGGFEAAYLIAALGGLWATLRIRASVSVADE